LGDLLVMLEKFNVPDIPLQALSKTSLVNVKFFPSFGFPKQFQSFPHSIRTFLFFLLTILFLVLEDIEEILDRLER